MKELIDFIKQVVSRQESSIKVGQKVFIRTVTYHYTGRVKSIDLMSKELCLTDAAWIADSGRFADAIASGIFEEVEPYPDNAIVIINTDTIVDKTVVLFDLPRVQR